jgi:hypothetical protein
MPIISTIRITSITAIIIPVINKQSLENGAKGLNQVKEA